jgi:hypothetical protein
VIFSASAVMVMNPKGEGNDRLEIADSLMSQLLSIFDLGIVFCGVVEKPKPMTHLGSWSLDVLAKS